VERSAGVKKVSTAFAVGGAAVALATAMIPQAQAAAVKPQSPKQPHKKMVIHPDTSCVGSTENPRTSGPPSLTFWYTKEANSLVCVGTVEGDYPFTSFSGLDYFRVRVWEDGVLFSSRHFTARTIETSQGTSTSGYGAIRLEFDAPVEVCDAFVYDNGAKVSNATCDTPPDQ
jgi:hypothetical protein